MQRKLFLALFLVFIIGIAHAQVLLNYNSTYSYLKGSQASSLASNWMTKAFNDSNWATGKAPFRYGDGSGGTNLTDMQNSYSTVYLRTVFTASDISNLENLNFTFDYDDGFIVWVNGQISINRNGPSNPSYNSFSTDLHEFGEPESITINQKDLNLTEGNNLVAIQVFNTSLESSDMYFDMQIAAQYKQPEVPTTSDSLKVIFDHEAGFYTDNISLKMQVPDDSYNFIYTIDGSNPQTSPTAQNGGKEKTITINPSSNSGRGKTPGYIVRASLVQGNLAPSRPITKTYLFLENVKSQSAPGGTWPTFNVNGQIIDLDMDQKITMSGTYSSEIIDALTDIPSLSVVTDNANLFDSGIGIYVNADGHGEEWERFCSVELLDPKDAKNKFNVNAGLRIRGGWSRHDDFPKHSFRLFFREEYGASKLEFPLFGDEGVDEYDKIDLRTAQNYAWSNGDSRNTMVREVFSRDSQRDMGQPYTRSRYYHLYLNGMYWGLYQTQERSEARFASDYLGGNKEDYDVVKVNTENYSYRIEATDGELNAWQEIWNACQKGFSKNADYFALEGKDSNGNHIKGAKTILDIDNLIDYMLTIFYTGNFDAPTSAFGGNGGPNNFYAIYKRDDKSKGFVFFNHDAEHAMMIDNASPGIGLEENRVEPSGMSVGDFSGFHPQWLHHKLTDNAEYRQRFADRAYKALENNGVFTPDVATRRFESRAKEIEKAIIAESARWGDAKSGSPYTKQTWSNEITHVVDDFFPYRTDIVIDQLTDADLYPTVFPPKFTVNNETIETEKYFFDKTTKVKITITQTSGDIYITKNGTDPRMVGGGINPEAEKITPDSELELRGTTWIKARVKRGSEWSSMRDLRIVKSWEDYFNLKVTELNYNPSDSLVGLDTVSGKSFEFIEIKNVGGHSCDLSQLMFFNGIEYKFKPDDMLAPDQFFVIASSSKWFYERYGMSPSDIYKGSFNNSGEIVSLLSQSRREVFAFQYSDVPPWPLDADGLGYSLTSAAIYPTGNPNDIQYWKKSNHVHGSPFYNDTSFPVNVDEQVAFDLGDIKVYPNPTANFLFFNVNEEKPIDVEIYNAAGQSVYRESMNSNTVISLNQIGARQGLLLVKLSTATESIVRKVLYQP